MARKKPNPNGRKLPPKLQFDYIKSNFFRVVHSDGVWGGLTGRKGIVMSFWSERPPIPQHVVHGVTAEGKLGDEIKSERVEREAIIREVEVAVLMDLSAAKALMKWLQEKVAAGERLAGEETPEAE